MSFNRPTYHCCIFIAALTLVCVGAASSSGAVSFSLEPTNTIALPGQNVALTLVASDPASRIVAGYDLDVVFDPAVLTVVSYSPTGALGDLLLGEAFDFSLGASSPGRLNLTVLSALDGTALGMLQQGPFAVASILLQVGPGAPGGVSLLSLTANAVTDAAGAPIVPTSLAGASITVIPEPSVALLIGGGLTVLAGRRRAVLRAGPTRRNPTASRRG